MAARNPVLSSSYILRVPSSSVRIPKFDSVLNPSPIPGTAFVNTLRILCIKFLARGSLFKLPKSSNSASKPTSTSTSALKVLYAWTKSRMVCSATDLSSEMTKLMVSVAELVNKSNSKPSMTSFTWLDSRLTNNPFTRICASSPSCCWVRFLVVSLKLNAASPTAAGSSVATTSISFLAPVLAVINSL